jgi:hypothetical protein
MLTVAPMAISPDSASATLPVNTVWEYTRAPGSSIVMNNSNLRTIRYDLKKFKKNSECFGKRAILRNLSLIFFKTIYTRLS